MLATMPARTCYRIACREPALVVCGGNAKHSPTCEWQGLPGLARARLASDARLMYSSCKPMLWAMPCWTAVLLLMQAQALLGFGARTHMQPEEVRPLKKYALKWHMALGACLAASLALSRHPVLHAL